MEALHVMVQKGKFKGLNLSKDGPSVSHLFYANNALFFGEWSATNLKNLNRILRCFDLASGLKVNLNKNNVYGVGVGGQEVADLANILHCRKGEFPSVYLGLPVEANMNRVANWKPAVDVFNAKLSAWKVRDLSFARRVVLIKSVLGSITNYYLSFFKAPVSVLKTLEGIRRRFLWRGGANGNKIRWVVWERILKGKKGGGLGVGGIKEMNLGLLTKWWWRYKNNGDQTWVKVIRAIHEGGRSDNLGLEQQSIKSFKN
ncbi:uncharacterized protein LOC110924275 [Helianthus annuus]|uniref:uncharacterized protein LOC110924275 n=1 Tax=Helianthus annuus TaxID=4232 RepID=UPI000B905E4A|nr:uncharacterized protein LOC110924275 [Helianthus annuus]